MAISENLKRVLHLLADGSFHSGTELSESLGISRSAICKQMQSLADLGIELCAVSGKGYKLGRPISLLSLDQIRQHLTPQASGLLGRIEVHDVIASTNSYLLQAAHSGDAKGFACFAESQSAGKGRRGRIWRSPFGANIYLSVLWRYQDGPATINGLSLAVGVAVVRALRQLGIGDVGLKWPNDIYWKQRKLAGILIEVAGESGGPCYTVTGLGLNCYIPPHEAKGIDQEWVDLDTLLGHSTHELRNQLAAELLNHLLPIIADFDSRGLSPYLPEWRENDCMQGSEACLYMGQQRYDGIVEGVNAQGMLQLRDERGESKTFASGEVSFKST